MKRFLYIFSFLVIFSFTGYSQQAQKPVIMVVPDKNWCIKNGATNEVGDPDYNLALQNEDMSRLIVAMGDIMSGQGYELQLLSECLDQLKTEEGYDMEVLRSKGDGSLDGGEKVVETDADKVTRVAKADILINLSFKVNNYGGVRHQVEFTVTGVDAATSKQISGNVGNSSASSAPIPSLLNEAVYGFMDNFCSKLDRHFSDIEKNGREGVVIFKIAQDCPYTFESEVYLNGETGELSEVIEYWLNENTVNGGFNKSGRARNRLAFNQVRFPMFSAGGKSFGLKPAKPRALDMENFMRPIEDFLAQLNISCSFQPVGIGKVFITLGSK